MLFQCNNGDCRQISDYLKEDFGTVYRKLRSMECRKLITSKYLSYGSNLEYYCLTSYGCYMAYYWYNRECFDEIFYALRNNGYSKKSIDGFMRDGFLYYHHTYNWKFHDYDLEYNYLSWCRHNGVEPKTGKLGRILKIIYNKY